MRAGPFAIAALMILSPAAVGAQSKPRAAPGHKSEPYEATAKAYASCVGEQARLKLDPPELIAEVIDLKCSKLEELERDQFADFIKAQVGSVFTAETALTMYLHLMVSPPTLRRMAIKSYLTVMRKSQVKEPLAIDPD
jgi:hypothetical protein